MSARTAAILGASALDQGGQLVGAAAGVVRPAGAAPRIGEGELHALVEHVHEAEVVAAERQHDQGVVRGERVKLRPGWCRCRSAARRSCPRSPRSRRPRRSATRRARPRRAPGRPWRSAGSRAACAVRSDGSSGAGRVGVAQRHHRARQRREHGRRRGGGIQAAAEPSAVAVANAAAGRPRTAAADAPGGGCTPPRAGAARQAAAITVAVRAPAPVSQTRLELHTVAPFMQRVTDKQASIAGPAQGSNRPNGAIQPKAYVLVFLLLQGRA